MNTSKHKWILVVCFLIPVLCSPAFAGPTADPTPMATVRTGFSILGTALSAGAEPSDPAVNGRSYTQIIATSKAIVWKNIPEKFNTLLFRFSEKTEGSADTVWQVYVAWDQTVFHKIGTVTLDTGQQTAVTTDYEFADGVVWSGNWITTVKAVSPGSNLAGLLAFDSCGIWAVAFVPTTLTSDAQVEGTGY